MLQDQLLPPAQLSSEICRLYNAKDGPRCYYEAYPRPMPMPMLAKVHTLHWYALQNVTPLDPKQSHQSSARKVSPANKYPAVIKLNRTLTSIIISLAMLLALLDLLSTNLL